MASITHDGRTFIINERRRWLVGATIDLGRHDRRLWPALLDSVRAAGFNTLGVRLAWSMHERAPGSFDFTGDLDAAALIRAAGERRLFVLLRPGPYVGAGFDAGGLPGWLVDGRPEIVRTGDGAFKEAVSRWFSALFGEVGGLQLLSRGAGGPIILVQNEHAYFKGSDALAGEYLTETARFLREAGARVPIINGNNLFAPPRASSTAGSPTATPSRPSGSSASCALSLRRSNWTSRSHGTKPSPKPPRRSTRTPPPGPSPAPSRRAGRCSSMGSPRG